MAATKTTLSLCGGLLCVAAIVSFGRQSQHASLNASDLAAQSPAIASEESAWDFGNVEPGRAYRATFVIKNTGARRLVLLQRESSCDCLSSGVKQVFVDARRSAEIELALNTSNLSGAVSQEVQFSTNDPAQPLLVFRLAANVIETPNLNRELMPVALPQRPPHRARDIQSDEMHDSILRPRSLH